MTSRVESSTNSLGRFRADLMIRETSDAQRALHRVRDPQTGTTFDLDDLEYNVARLLDGRRTADDVSAEMRRRGFYVDPRHVASFHRELRGLGFLAQTEHRQSSDHRSDADAFTAQGQEYLRDGRISLARGLFEAALVIDPQSAAARQGLDQCQSSLDQVVPDSEALPSLNQSLPIRPWGSVMLAAGAALVVGAGATWLLVQPQTHAAANPATPSVSAAPPIAAAPPAIVQEDEVGPAAMARATTQASQRVQPAGAVELEPDHGGSAPQLLRIIERDLHPIGEVVAPSGGVVAECLVHEPRDIEIGTPILSIQSAAGQRSLRRLRTRVRELRALASQSDAYVEYLRTAQRRLNRARRQRRATTTQAVETDQKGIVVVAVNPADAIVAGQVIATVNAVRLRIEVPADAALQSIVVSDGTMEIDATLVGAPGTREWVELPGAPAAWANRGTELTALPAR